MNGITARPVRIDRFVSRLARLERSLCPHLAHSVATAEFAEIGWKSGPEAAAHRYAGADELQLSAIGRARRTLVQAGYLVVPLR